ncbi:ABC transporter ATP-binding protein [Dactylosporangium sp. CA-233914]|uniref:ABC transporter ATP-binding protein n=1 Tax=Dactylosporangium sp. CA-233914 TaxID=3239934 RepID=UPI003D8F6026
MPMQAAIVAEDIRKAYGPTQAVDGVSLTVARGEFFGILGPNGAGKTTTLEIVEGLRRPDSGRVEVLGQPPTPRTRGMLRRIGVQIQGLTFFERLTAREQIRTFAALYKLPASRADEVLEMLGLTDKADTLTERLSGGQAQRLSIGCAIVHAPELLFLDEPTAGLDPQARRNLWDVLRGLNERDGCTVVLTTHYMDEAEELCHRVAIMDTGRVLRADPPATLIRDLGGVTRISMPAAALAAEQARKLFPEAVVDAEEETPTTGTLTIRTTEPAAVLAELAARDALRGLSVRGTTLEDVFLSLTGREYRA